MRSLAWRMRASRRLAKFGTAAELLSGDYVIVPFRFLEQVEVTSVGVERFKREHPELARQAGIE